MGEQDRARQRRAAHQALYRRITLADPVAAPVQPPTRAAPPVPPAGVPDPNSRSLGERLAALDQTKPQPNTKRRKGKKNKGRAHRAPRHATCHYCEAVATTWDHIVPRSAGGPGAMPNLVPACLKCNQAKADQMPTCPCDKCRNALAVYGLAARAPHARPPATDDGPHTPEGWFAP